MGHLFSWGFLATWFTCKEEFLGGGVSGRGGVGLVAGLDDHRGLLQPKLSCASLKPVSHCLSHPGCCPRLPLRVASHEQCMVRWMGWVLWEQAEPGVLESRALSRLPLVPLLPNAWRAGAAWAAHHHPCHLGLCLPDLSPAPQRPLPIGLPSQGP